MEEIQSNDMLNNMINQIKTLYNNHKNDEFIISRLVSEIQSLEEKMLIQKEEHTTRIERKCKLTTEKDAFIKSFHQNHKYYYIADSDIFIEYDGDQYNQLTESKIWSEIYNEINKNKTLTPWKQKVRIEIISLIKKNTIFNVQLIPESHTIQRVLQILQSILLPNKYYCKYFLTLLGDCLLKKNDSQNIIISTNTCDKFLQELEFQIHHFMKCYFIDIFKNKYHNHNYNSIRILQTKECDNNSFIWETTLKKYIFDIIFVSCHYSKRYENADNYLNKFCNNSETTEKILFCKYNTKENILNSFTETMFESNDTLYVFRKDLKYIINQYFDLIQLPKVLFYTDVEEYFNKKFPIMNDNETFMYKGITSKDSTFISSFLSFFNETFDIDPSNETTYELDELLLIYTKKCRHKKYTLNEKMLSSLLNHYYENIQIVNNKYVTGINCKIWNKTQDIQDFLKTIKYETHNICDSDTDSVSTNNTLYEKYCNWCNLKNKHFVVSKDFFDENN